MLLFADFSFRNRLRVSTSGLILDKWLLRYQPIAKGDPARAQRLMDRLFSDVMLLGDTVLLQSLQPLVMIWVITLGGAFCPVARLAWLCDHKLLVRVAIFSIFIVLLLLFGDIGHQVLHFIIHHVATELIAFGTVKLLDALALLQNAAKSFLLVQG